MSLSEIYIDRSAMRSNDVSSRSNLNFNPVTRVSTNDLRELSPRKEPVSDNSRSFELSSAPSMQGLRINLHRTAPFEALSPPPPSPREEATQGFVLVVFATAIAEGRERSTLNKVREGLPRGRRGFVSRLRKRRAIRLCKILAATGFSICNLLYADVTDLYRILSRKSKSF